MMLKQVGSHRRRMKVDPHFTTYTKINSEWIEDLKIMPKTIKILEENIGVNLHHLRLGNGLSDMTPKSPETEGKLDKLCLIKI